MTQGRNTCRIAHACRRTFADWLFRAMMWRKTSATSAPSANVSDELYFALLSDWPDSDRELSQSFDTEILDFARAEINRPVTSVTLAGHHPASTSFTVAASNRPRGVDGLGARARRCTSLICCCAVMATRHFLPLDAPLPEGVVHDDAGCGYAHDT